MRIGIFDPYLDTMSGGEKYMLSAASCLAKEHEVEIFWDKNKETEIRQVAARKLGIDLAKVKFYQNIFDKNYSLASRFLESKKFDAVFYLSDGSIPLVGTKLFVHFQFPIEWVDGKSLKNKIKLSFAKKIFCNSIFTKDFIDKKLNVNSEVLYPPVNLHNKNIKKENAILHVGRFDVDSSNSNYKKQDVMISVFKKMINEGLKNWKFVLVIGTKSEDKNNVEKLRKMTDGYPIEIIENPSNEALWEYYSKARIYWHATGYGQDLQKYPEKAEHFGISTVEAMGSGAVPVVINAGGQREIIRDGENGFLWSSLEEFARKTADLIKDVKLWKKISENAIGSAQLFSDDKFCRNLKNLLNR